MKRLIVLGLMLPFLALAAPVAADGVVIELPRADRSYIEKYIGTGIVGKALEAKTIGDVHEYLPLRPGTIVTNLTHGRRPRAKGQSGARIDRLERDDGLLHASMEKPDGTNYGQVTEEGHFVVHSASNKKQGVLTRYDPPEPVLRTGMKPGESRKKTIGIKVYDLTNTERRRHTGSLDLTYTYIGAYEVTVPAGTFETVLFKWEYDGKVGPASVKDTQYWFFGRDIGPVAMIEETSVSAMLIYNDHTKFAHVLVERRYDD
jgi:hypothetical protein